MPHLFIAGVTIEIYFFGIFSLDYVYLKSHSLLFLDSFYFSLYYVCVVDQYIERKTKIYRMSND